VAGFVGMARLEDRAREGKSFPEKKRKEDFMILTDDMLSMDPEVKEWYMMEWVAILQQRRTRPAAMSRRHRGWKSHRKSQG
jgi:hypothetical protein